MRTKITDSLLAIFTFGLFVATWFLWRATRDLVRGAEKISARQLRAYISVEKFETTPLSDNPIYRRIHSWELKMKWQNTGQTPTKNMLSHVSARFEADELPENFRFPDMWVIGRKKVYPPEFLAPNSSNYGGAFVFSVPQLQAVREGKMTLYMWGWADYDDIFPDTPRHRTEFCVQVSLPGDPAFGGDGGSSSQIAFNLYWKHNGYDDECMRKPTTKVPRERIPDIPKSTS